MTCSRSASFPASTSRTAASSRASISSTCATPAIRSRRRSPMTPPAPTSCRFLDITASHENRGIILDVVRRTAEACFMPLTVGGGVRTIDDIRKLLHVRRRQGLDQHRGGRTPRLREGGGGKIRRPMHRGRDRRQESLQAGRARPLGNLHPWRPQSDRPRRGRLCQGSGGARRRRNPAHLDGPRRHPAGLRHRADARGGRCRPGAGDRLRRRRHARSPGRRHPRRPRHRRAGRLDLPFRRAQRAGGQGSTWPAPGCRCGSIRNFAPRTGRLAPEECYLRHEQFHPYDLESACTSAPGERRDVLYAQAARQGRGALRQEARRGGGRDRARRRRRGPRAADRGSRRSALPSAGRARRRAASRSPKSRLRLASARAIRPRRKGLRASGS